MRSMYRHPTSDRTSTTRPWSEAILYGLSRSTIDRATRGSRRMSLAFHDDSSVHTRRWSPSSPTHTTWLRGEPSARSVDKCAELGASSSARTSSGIGIVFASLLGSMRRTTRSNVRAFPSGLGYAGVATVPGWRPPMPLPAIPHKIRYVNLPSLAVLLAAVRGPPEQGEAHYRPPSRRARTIELKRPGCHEPSSPGLGEDRVSRPSARHGP